MRFKDRLAGAVQYTRYEPWNFGLAALDSVIQGVRPGFNNLVIARPHVGKTLLVVCGIRNNPDVPTLFISADDDPDVVVRKMMQFDGVIEDGWRASPDMMTRYIEDNYPNLDIVDDVAWGPVRRNDMFSLPDAIERFDKTYGTPPGLVVYDYLGIEGNSFDMATSIASWMKSVAKELPMPILTIAQSRRQQGSGYRDGKRLGFSMDELQFGGEQQAGLMIGLTKSRRGNESVIEIDVVKNKAVFDGSGLTAVESPVVLFHRDGRLVTGEEIFLQQRASQALYEQIAREEMVDRNDF